MKSKSQKREHKLPLYLRNKLRGSRGITNEVSLLRRSISISQFPALIDAIPFFLYRGRSILPAVGVSVGQFHNDTPILDQVPIALELAWTTAIFARNAKLICRFVQLKDDLERAILLGQFDQSELLLNQLEQELGFSFWLLEMRLAVLQTGRGLEAQKAYSSSLRAIRREGDLVAFLAYNLSWRNEDTTNPFQFKKTISERAAEWKIEKAFS